MTKLKHFFNRSNERARASKDRFSRDRGQRIGASRDNGEDLREETSSFETGSDGSSSNSDIGRDSSSDQSRGRRKIKVTKRAKKRRAIIDYMPLIQKNFPKKVDKVQGRALIFLFLTHVVMRIVNAITMQFQAQVSSYSKPTVGGVEPIH